MNILYLCDEYPPGKHGGIGTVVQTLAREMVKQGHKVIVAGMYDWGYAGEDEFNDNGVQVFRFRHSLASSWFNAQSSLRVRLSYRLLGTLGILQWDIQKSITRYKLFLEGLIKKYAIDVVEMPDYNDYMRFCKKEIYFPELSVPVVVKLHGSMTYFAREANGTEPLQVHRMEQDVFNKAAAVASVSKYTAGKTKSYFDIAQDIHVVYNGIETQVTVPDRKKIAGRVIFTGTLAEKKGIYQLMKAWNIVVEENTKASLYIYGKGSTAKAVGLLTENAKRTVSFKGHVSRAELMENIETAQIGVFPSYAETFGLAPLECMVHKTAVIFTKCTSGPEIVDDGVNGILVDPDNVDMLAEKILYLLSHPEACENYVASAEKMVKDKFDIGLIAKHNVDIYDVVLNRRNG
jgi:glycosyltransferase involved in cell wall biosynthesis